MTHLLRQAAGSLALFLFAGLAWTAPPQLIVPHDVGDRKRLPERNFVSEGTAVRFNKAEMLALRYLDEVEVRLPNGTAHPFVFELAQDHGGEIYSWVAKHKHLGNRHRAIVTTGPEGSFGIISTPEGDFRLLPGGSSGDWLMDVTAEQPYMPITSLGNDVRIPPADAPKAVERHQPHAFSAIPGYNTIGFAKATPTPHYFVDIMFVYTQGFAMKLGGTLMTRLNFLVTRANTAYADSEVAISLRMVHAMQVNYTDAGDNGDALADITPGRPQFDSATFGSIEGIRNTYGADIVALMRDGSDFGGSGVSWLGSATPDPSFMYSVTTGCMQSCESVWIHEVGHNMGNSHDRPTAAWQNGGNTTYFNNAGNAFGYAYCSSGTYSCNAFIANGSPGACGPNSDANNQPECSAGPSDQNNFSDIMAYFHGSTDRVYKFSNPNITCNAPGGASFPCGIAGVGGSSADTAGSMNARRAALSAIKSPTVTGLIEFSGPLFSGNEGGNVTLTVKRLGTFTGTAGATWTATSGTATTGSDFSTTSGTVSWADGESADKTIVIATVSDAVVEGNESFTVTLSNVTGSGTALGSQVTATGIILETWPPGGVGTLPAGLTTPANTPVHPAWAVANDYSNDGDGVSLKSGTLVYSNNCDNGAGQMRPCASRAQYTATFGAGVVAFSYRVSGIPNIGFLEFLVDGGVVLSATGGSNAAADSGWLSFSAPLSAGVHTLEWRYRTTLTFNCASAVFTVNGVPESGPRHPQCADRGWIDSLSLPSTGPVTYALTVTNVGTGIGAVTSSPAGINCPGDCTESYAGGTGVTLTATPGTDSAFAGWSGGGCSGTGQCTVTMNAAAAVTATFNSTANPPRLANISTRMQVLTGDNVLIGGLIISGSTPKTVVVRARGPSLTAAGVPNVLANPVLNLYSGQTVIASNDDWQTAANASTLQASGFAPANAQEAAIYMTLNPGAYTAIVQGAGGTTGVGLVEVFEVDALTTPLINIATRGQVLTGDNVMIGGFIIQGSGPQTVVVRARGPSLTAAGVPNVLANPVLNLYSGQTVIASNDDWQTASNQATLLASGFAPSSAQESAVYITLNPGAYTAIVSGVGGTTGVGIVEVFAVP